jgi:hypothetical protein
LLFLVSGCAGGGHPPTDALLRSGAIERTCGPPPGAHAGIIPLPAPPQESRAQNNKTLSEKDFSAHALAPADIIGAHDLVVRLPILKREAVQNIEGATVRLPEARQQLSDRILLAFLDMARTAAEADCEEERADQLADRLQEARDKRVRRQTLIAIIGDAMIGIASGGLSLAAEATASAATAILGGSVATGFGLAAVFGNTEYEFQHERNLLREIWEGPAQPSLFPLSVWRYPI